MPSGRQHHRIGQIHRPLAGMEVKRHRTEAYTVFHQEAAHVAVLVNRDLQRLDAVDQPVQNRPARIVPA